MLAGAILLHCVAAFHVFFNVLYPEPLLRRLIESGFRTSFGKAVQCKEVSMNFAGNIIIDNINISITSDFNDNISLLKAGRAVVTLDFVDALTGSPSINGFRCRSAELFLPKRYGKGYQEWFEQTFNPSRVISFAHRGKGMRISIRNSHLIFRESLKEKVTVGEIDNLGCEIDISSEAVTYSIEGRIKPCLSSGTRRGSVSCAGVVALGNRGPNGNTESFSHRIRLDSFDLECLNSRIEEYQPASFALNGAVSADMDISKKGGVLSLSGGVEASGLSVTSLKDRHSIILNDSMEIEIDGFYDEARNYFKVNRLKAADEAVSIKASGEYVRNKQQDRVRAVFTTNRIDLNDLSAVLRPIPNIAYSGRAKAEGAVAIDFIKNSAAGTNATLVVENFTLSRKGKNESIAVIDESDLSLNFAENLVKAQARFRPVGSHYRIALRTDITGWRPFKSSTEVTVRSNVMRLHDLAALVTYAIDKIFEAAYNDRMQSFDGTPFLQRPMGQFINSNGLILDAEMKTMVFARKAMLRNGRFKFRIERGVALLDTFNIEGYDAAYRLGMQGYFNTDQPYVKIDGKVTDFDLKAFYDDARLPGSMGGKARFDFGYELSASRISDMLDNAKGNFNLFVGTGEMKGTELQRRLSGFFAKNGFANDVLSENKYQDITLSVSQVGDNFWFTNFGIKGDTLFFAGRGDYTWQGGVNGMINVSVRSGDRMLAIPLQVKGPLLAPCLEVFGKKDGAKLCF